MGLRLVRKTWKCWSVLTPKTLWGGMKTAVSGRDMARNLLSAGCVGWLLASAPAMAQLAAPSAVDITKADIDLVLKHAGSEGAGTDRQIRVVDVGEYRLGVGVLHRGPTTPGVPVNAISHTSVTEVYYILSGAGTLLTGGSIQNPQEFASDIEFVRVAVGPSVGGTFAGGTRRRVGPGDVIVIPAGVPHGFDEVADHVTYLSIRPDVVGVLPPSYVHPALRK
jgi:mannose-6-phosphate isomerase-like protein (cupin superfamily)